VWNSGDEGIAGDPHPDSLCFKRLRAMVANRVETLDGDEASRFRTIPLSSSGSALAMNVSTMRLTCSNVGSFVLEWWMSRAGIVVGRGFQCGEGGL